MGSIIVSAVLGERLPNYIYVLAALLLGFIAYGLSIKFYVIAQNTLGAAKTSAFYSIAPFLGVGFSFVLLHERPKVQFFIALAVMIISTVIMIKDTLAFEIEKK